MAVKRLPDPLPVVTEEVVREALAEHPLPWRASTDDFNEDGELDFPEFIVDADGNTVLMAQDDGVLFELMAVVIEAVNERHEGKFGAPKRIPKKA